MPLSPQQNQQLRAESVRRLLAAARTVFVRLGYDRATIRDIAQEAGVAQGLLYNYFRSKDDLLREVFHAGVRDVAESLDAGAAAADPSRALELVIRRGLEIVREHRDFWLLSYMLRFQPRTRVLGEELTAWTAAVRAQLEVKLRAIGHRDAAALARVLFAAIDGVAQHWAIDPDTYPLEPTIDRLVRHFCEPPTAPRRAAASRGASRASSASRPRVRPESATSEQRPKSVNRSRRGRTKNPGT